ncbi:MAG: hypothetical protein M0R03_23700 [Novosphingobium sp.]|nr:hypothetical protein [Novosphingobium sp.]
MTDKEILAQLKKSYEYILDITENGSQIHCNGQMDRDNTTKLEDVLSELEDVYYDFYKTLDREELKIKKQFEDIEEPLYIARTIGGDYEYKNDDDDADSLTCGDLGYYWYDDTKFIMDMGE